jgi:hypothetical protein
VRKTFIALAATTGLIGLTSVGASAATVTPMRPPAGASNVQQADWYCGPRCQYWRHRHWEAERRHWWHEHHRPYYGYNYGYHGYPYYR